MFSYIIVKWVLSVNQGVFRAIGFFNEADTFESSSILIYSISEQSILTNSGRHEAVLIKKVKFKKGTINEALFISINQGI